MKIATDNLIFKKANLSLGLIEPGKEVTVIFEYAGVHSIEGIRYSCTCTSATHYPALKRIEIKYTPKQEYPEHLKGQPKKNLQFIRYIWVQRDGILDEEEELQFEGLIKHV